MIITNRLSPTWHIGIIIQLIFMLAVGPGAAQLRFTTSSFDEVQFGKPFPITWDGIDIETTLYIALLSDLDVETIDVAFPLSTSTTEPGQREFVWTPDESNFTYPVVQDPDFQFYIEMVAVDQDGNPDASLGLVKSPDFAIHPRDKDTEDPDSVSSTTSEAPTSSTESTAPPTSTSTNTVTPPAPSNGGLSSGAKIGIGIGAAIAALILATIAGWFYGRSFRNKKTENPPTAVPVTAQNAAPSPPAMPSPPPASPPPEVQANAIAPNDYTDRRYRPYSDPATLNPQAGGAPVPGLTGVPGPFLNHANTMPAVHVASELGGRPMSVPPSLIPGYSPNGPNRHASWQGPVPLPYPVD
ncbi:hypothetical protein V8F20_010917 [Naviculisporaceae sp. PSN 640]